MLPFELIPTACQCCQENILIFALWLLSLVPNQFALLTKRWCLQLPMRGKVEFSCWVKNWEANKQYLH